MVKIQDHYGSFVNYRGVIWKCDIVPECNLPSATEKYCTEHGYDCDCEASCDNDVNTVEYILLIFARS